MHYKPKEVVEPPKEEKKAEVNVTEALYSLNDIVELSKAVKIYKNLNVLIGKIDNMITSLEFMKSLLIDENVKGE